MGQKAYLRHLFERLPSAGSSSELKTLLPQHAQTALLKPGRVISLPGFFLADKKHLFSRLPHEIMTPDVHEPMTP